MKKKMVLIVCLLILFSLGNNIGLAKTRKLSTELGKVTTYAGFNYNSYSLNQLHDAVVKKTDLNKAGEQIDSGLGFYMGARQWFSKDVELEVITENMPWVLGNAAVGIEIENMGVSYEKVNVSAANTGFLVTYSHRLSAINEKIRDCFLVTAGAGFYQGNLNYLEESITCRGLGFKLGMEGAMPIKKIIDSEFTNSPQRDIAIGGRINYRSASPHSDGLLNFSGFELALQVEGSF